MFDSLLSFVLYVINLNGLILQKSQELLPLHVALPIPILYSDCMNVRTLSSWSSSGWTIPPMCRRAAAPVPVMELSVSGCVLRVPNGTDPQLFRQAVCLLKRELFGGFPCIPVKHQRGWLFKRDMVIAAVWKAIYRLASAGQTYISICKDFLKKYHYCWRKSRYRILYGRKIIGIRQFRNSTGHIDRRDWKTTEKLSQNCFAHFCGCKSFWEHRKRSKTGDGAF